MKDNTRRGGYLINKKKDKAMTRDMCKAILPVIQAFVDGEHIEYWDSLQIVAPWERGMWKTTDNIGFGVHVSNYRVIKDDTAYYFDGREPSKTFNQYQK